MVTLGRNEPCHCGSGKKYKKCHLEKDEQVERKTLEKMAFQPKAEAAESGSAGKKPPQKEQGWFKKILGRAASFKQSSTRNKTMGGGS